MAQTFEVSVDLVLEAWFDDEEDGEGEALLELRSAEDEDDQQSVTMYASDVQQLVAALVDAAVWLASGGG